MNEPRNICGIDPVDLINNRGLLQSILELPNDVILVLEPASSQREQLSIRFANKAARNYFDGLDFQTDRPSINISLRSGISWKEFIKSLSLGSVFEEEIFYADRDSKTQLHLTGSKVGDTRLLVSLKKVLPTDLPGAPGGELPEVDLEKELTEQQHFIEQVFQASPVLINIYDLGTETFIYFSKEVAPFIGYTSKAMLAMSPEELQGLIVEADRQRVVTFYHGFGNTGDEIRTIEYPIKAMDGTYRWLKVRAKVFRRNKSGEVSQIICAVQDHTLYKQAEDQVRENELMHLLLQRKDEFINVASHELKSPITSVKASLQILQRLMDRHEKDAIMAVFLRKALSQINKLADLTRDLIDNAKLQSGKMHLNPELFDLDSLLSEIIEEQMEGFEIIVHNSVKRQVRADRRRLEQVIKNFLSNAAKYSPLASKIVIRAEERDNSFRVSVQDFGIGIPKDKLSSVFDRYYRVDEQAIQFPGLGLGLHISAEIIKMHGGDYGVESVEGQGSTFWLSIPDVDVANS